MGRGAWRWGVFLLLWPLAACAGHADLRVTALSSAPAMGAGHQVEHPAGPPGVASEVWLHAPRGRVAWYALRLAGAWRRVTAPLLAIHGNVRARATVYLPPDYKPRTDSVFDARLDPGFSHDAVVYPLPAGLDPRQPIYVALGDPGQSQPIRFSITDRAAYRAGDLSHVRISTFFASVQVSMVLVILCFWIVLRDRMFVYFMVYVGAQVLYDMSVSGELYALPGAVLLTPLGYHTGQCMAALAAGFSIWFILEFAELRRYTPRLAAVLAALRWPFLALAAIIWIPRLRPDAWLPNTVNLLLVASTVVALASSWLAWRRGNRQAGFFLLSWIPLLALTMARVVQLLAGLPLPAWLEYGFPGSMAWAAVIITAGLADRTLQVRHERDQATHMAQFDPLTGVFNRRAVMDRLADAWRVAESASEPLAVLFLDIDHFKQINDGSGHAAGDECLCAVTEAIRAELGRGDQVGRYGGEEFLVLLRGDSARMATRVAERIVARAAALRVQAGAQLIALTVSIGIAMRDATVTGIEALVERADAAQYLAKAEGRNRAVAWRRDATVASSPPPR